MPHEMDVATKMRSTARQNEAWLIMRKNWRQLELVIMCKRH